jgi:hypothetical protein
MPISSKQTPNHDILPLVVLIPVQASMESGPPLAVAASTDEHTAAVAKIM